MILKVNYILDNSRVQGPGERFTIWTQGCSIHCSGCNNKDTWPFDKGDAIPIELLKQQVMASLSPGLTITGGEPLDQLEAVLELTKGVFDFKNIFLCSGYTLDYIKNDTLKSEILKSVDIVCTGPFDQNQVCQSEWKGSSNQEIIHLTERGKKLLDMPFYKREYRINKTTGDTVVTGFSM